MTGEMILQLLIACFLGLLTIVGALCTWIFNTQKNSFDAFAKDSALKIDKLTESINNLNTEIAKIVTIVEQHDEAIKELKKNTGSLRKTNRKKGA